MGNSNSSTEDDMTRVGYRVLGVQANSPAAKGGLVSFFDFIVQANGIPLRSLDSTFIDLIKVSVAFLGVWLCKFVLSSSLLFISDRLLKTSRCRCRYTTGKTSR